MTEDAAAIAQVHVAAWRAAYRGIMPDTTLATLSVADRQANWTVSIAKGEPTVLVAESNGELVGFLALGPTRDSDAPPGTLEILVLYVAPSFWSRGAGRALCQACRSVASARGVPLVSLWVLVANEPARRFYSSVGFAEQTGTSRPYERDGVSLNQVRYVQPIAG
jgi:ribosomal protein S18 acetylase RimI-like enzyme